MHDWQRARREEQVAARVQAILDAASRLFDNTTYDEVTLQRIAEEAGFTRSNIYRYFESRETIFLRLYRDGVERWVADLQRALPEPPASGAPANLPAFVELWTNVLLRQERLLRLTPLLSLSLERNSSEALYREFKEFTVKVMDQAAEFLAPYLPGLDDARIQDFFLLHQALLAGAHPMARYSEMQKRVLAVPELAKLRLEFAAFYRRGILSLLRGLGARE